MSKRNTMVKKLKELTTPSFKGLGVFKRSGSEATLVRCKTQLHRDTLIANCGDYGLKCEVFD